MSIYIASKVKYADEWRKLRDMRGLPIVSSWIDHGTVTDTEQWVKLWEKCTREAASADVLVVFRSGNEELKGAWIEVGAAMAAGVPVIGVGIQVYSVAHHPLVETAVNIDIAMAIAMQKIAYRRSSQPPKPPLSVGDRVVKNTGDYTFDGVVVSVFNKTSGAVRYVVEHRDNRILHILSLGQLTKLVDDLPPSAR